MDFYKYHALGNDYIVLSPAEETASMTPELVQRLCQRHFGIGSDGILWGPLAGEQAELCMTDGTAFPADNTFALRIFNPDGSEAEKSGNGLRIFARYLWDTGQVDETPFTVLTLGGKVQCRILEQGASVTVDMGKVSFSSADIPVAGPVREVLEEQMTVADVQLQFCAATIGNPHCVILVPQVSADQTKELGPHIETDPRFPNRTNVQFMQVLDPGNLRIEIWERGAGYTLASGSSASASAAVARKLGLCTSEVTVHMPGGNAHIVMDHDFCVTLTGPVSAVANGTVAPELCSLIYSSTTDGADSTDSNLMLSRQLRQLE